AARCPDRVLALARPDEATLHAVKAKCRQSDDKPRSGGGQCRADAIVTQIASDEERKRRDSADRNVQLPRVDPSLEHARKLGRTDARLDEQQRVVDLGPG